MTYISHRVQFLFVAAVAASALYGSPVMAGGKGAPAGQMCPGGSYVIGFDSESNIICSGTGENIDFSPVETGTGAKTEMDSECGADCQPGVVDSGRTDAAVATKGASEAPGITSSIAALSISEVKPSTIVFGTREADITVTGTGFLPGSVIVFAGKKYSPSVNPEGTRLVVTIPTRNLSIGAYAVTVSNGPGADTTRKKALEIY